MDKQEIKVRVDDLKNILPSEKLVRNQMKKFNKEGFTKTSRRLIISYNRIKRKLGETEL